MTVLSEAIMPGGIFQRGTASVSDYSFTYPEFFPPTSTTMINPGEMTAEAMEVLSKINSYLSLKSNWDSYGAVQPGTAAIENASTFVKALDRRRVPVYFTAPGPNGEILVELKNGDKSIELTFEADGTSTYAKFVGDNCVEENSFRDEEASELIQWLGS